MLAVQALSRLNRCNAKMQKQDTFILDFYNTAAEIKAAFDDFYTAKSTQLRGFIAGWFLQKVHDPRVPRSLLNNETRSGPLCAVHQ